MRSLRTCNVKRKRRATVILDPLTGEKGMYVNVELLLAGKKWPFARRRGAKMVRYTPKDAEVTSWIAEHFQ